MIEERSHQNVIAALTEEAVAVTVTREPKGYWGRLMAKVGLIKTKRTFHIKPLKVGVLMRISARLEQLPDNLFGETEEETQSILPKALALHLPDLVYVVAEAIHNSESRAPKSLERIIKRDMDLPDLKAVCLVVEEQMRLQDFLAATVLVKGMNILPKTGPGRAGGTIAPGQQ